MKRIAELALLSLLGLALTALWLNYARFDLGPRNGLAELVAGTADRPFVYRQLAPLLVRGLMALGLELHAAATVLVGASFIGWLWALRWLAQAVTPKSAMVATVLACGPVGLLFVAGGYIYDPLTLCLFTLALALLAGEHWYLYALLFPALVLCRETAILLVPLYALLRKRDGLWDCLSQLVAFVVIRLYLAHAFAANPGADVEFNLPAQLTFLWAYPLPNVLALSMYGAALAAGLWRWADHPAFLRSAAIILPLMFAAYWLVGYPGEIRVFLEAYPVLYLLAWHTISTRAALPALSYLKQTARLS